MAVKNTISYIDTGSMGLVIQLEHNFDAVPNVVLTEIDSNGKEVYVSLMDSRVAEIKALDDNHIQFTFASSFRGYARLLSAIADNPSDHSRIIALEESYLNQYNLIENKVHKDQWIQMNNLFSAQLEDLQDQIKDLQSQINILKTEVDQL